ncbi:hypothetical protein [Streptomyces sp. NPDC001450]
MPTDHACQAAAELAAHSVDPIRALADTGHPNAGPAGDLDGRSVGAVVLLVFLDGLHAELRGTLSNWHSSAGDTVRSALGMPASQTEAGSQRGQPTLRQTLALVRARAQQVLTALADPTRNTPVRPGELPRRLNLVEDAFAGALRRTAVPEETAVRCSAGLAQAAGSLFGVWPSPPPRPPRTAPVPKPPRPAWPTAPLPPWTGGLP